MSCRHSMQLKTAGILFSLLFVSVLLSVSTCFFLRQNAEQISYYEFRSLAAYPDAEADTLSDGSWFQELETWFCDHAPLRDTVLRLKAWTDLHVLRRPVVNGIAVTDPEFLLNCDGYQVPDASLAQQAASRVSGQLDRVQQATERYGGTFLYALVPTHGSVLEDHYPWYLDNLHETTAVEKGALCSALDERGVSWLDIGEVWAREGTPSSYTSRTDHHWSLDGCMSACEAILERVHLDSGGTTPLFHADAFRTETASESYLGSYDRKICGMWNEQPLVYAERRDPIPFHRWDWDCTAEGQPVLFSPAPDSAGNLTYTFFMGGDISETVIQTDRPELPSLLIVGDSFTNLAETLLYGEFDEMRSLDFRFYNAMTLPEYIRLHQPDVVLVLRDYGQLLNLTGNGNLA